MRTAKSYLEGLRESDVRVWYKGERLRPLEIEKIRREASAIADYYQHHHRDPVNVVHSKYGRHSTTLLVTDTKEALKLKAESYYSLARNYCGIIGRPPDYINSVVSTWAGSADLFGPFAENVTAFYRGMVNNDLFVTHSTSELKGGPKSGIRVVAEKENGVVISGARAMATAAPICDEILIAPTRVQDDEIDKAIVCAIPADAEGLELICRYNFDGPSNVSGYFDESDAVVVLKDVFVPWEKVFIYRDLKAYNTVVKNTGTSPACSLQTNARAIAKLETIMELLQRWTEIHPKYQAGNFTQTAGKALRDLQILKALQNQALEQCDKIQSCWQPSVPVIEAAKMFFMESYPKIVSSLRIDMGADMFSLFTRDEIDPATALELCDQWGISADAFGKRQEVVMLLFDMLVSTFGVRHELYEQYFAGSPQRAISNYWLSNSGREMHRNIGDSLERVNRIYMENFTRPSFSNRDLEFSEALAQ